MKTRVMFFLVLMPVLVFCQETANKQNPSNNSDEKSDSVLFIINMGETSYLESHIIQYIKKLSSDNKIYSSILNSSDLLKQSKINSNIIDNFTYNRKEGLIGFSPELKNSISDITGQSSKLKNVLILRILQLNELLEFEFHLYGIIAPTEESKEDFSLLSSVQTQSSKSVNFFIDPRTTNYKEIINYELRKLFKESNTLPIATIRLNDRLIEDEKLYYFAKGDTIILNGHSSSDVETPFDMLNFHWSLEDENQASNIIGFNIHSSTQKLVITETGSYKLNLAVFDGISKSEKSSVNIEIIKRPVLKLDDNTYKKFHQSLLFKLDKSKFLKLDKSKFLKIEDEKIKCQPENIDTLTFELIRSSHVRLLKIDDKRINLRAKTCIVIPSVDSSSFCEQMNKDSVNDSNSARFVEYIPTLCVKNPAMDIQKTITLDFYSIPGSYKYKLFGEQHGVKSNTHTLFFDQVAYSPFYITFGYQVFRITNNSNFLDASIHQNFELGLKTYIINRLSADISFLIPIGYRNLSNTINDKIYPNNLKFDINYDFIVKHNMAYFTVFGSVYQFVFPDDDEKTGVKQIGVGISNRFDIIKRKSKLGLFFIEMNLGYYNSFVSDYQSIAYGFSLVYGFYK